MLGSMGPIRLRGPSHWLRDGLRYRLFATTAKKVHASGEWSLFFGLPLCIHSTFVCTSTCPSAITSSRPPAALTFSSTQATKRTVVVLLRDHLPDDAPAPPRMPLWLERIKEIMMAIGNASVSGGVPLASCVSHRFFLICYVCLLLLVCVSLVCVLLPFYSIYIVVVVKVNTGILRLNSIA